MSQPKRIIIVGGVAGGASCAARARRLSEDAQIILYERGDHISFANCGMPYYIAGVISDRDRLLVQTPQGMQRRYHIDVRTGQEVAHIDRQARKIRVRNLATGQETTEPYDTLVLSPGAEPIRPSIPGAENERVFTLRGLADMDRIHAALLADKPARAVIVGGGYIGLEMAEALRHRGVAVTMVEIASQVFLAADAEMVAPVHQQLSVHGVELRLNTSVTAIHSDGGGLTVRLSTGESLSCGMAILAAGVRPESHLAKEAGLEIGPSGGIVVDEHLRTSDPNIYAIGDVIEVTHLVGRHRAKIPLAGPANRQGRVAADNALGRSSVYRGSQGTAICKVFDLAVGMTGLSEKELRRLNRSYEKVYVHPASHASYYPGAQPLSLKLLFDPNDGKVLGAQAVGADGVDKRIDVLAVAIRAGMTVHDLADLELAYAPPYGSAKDPVNYAGFVAANVLDGDMAICHVADVLDMEDDQILLDVRTPAEVQAGTIPGAINIPIDTLRSRLDELPADKEVLAFCQVGLRGYLACRILSLNGRRCRNLSGGYKTYQAVGGMLPPETPRPPVVSDDAGEPISLPPAPEPRPAGGQTNAQIVREIDARSLQCPGPILKLKTILSEVEIGQAVSIVALDAGFPADVAGWCQSTGNELAGIVPADKGFRATVIRRPKPAVSASGPTDAAQNKTLVVFSGDFDKAMAAFIIANGAAAMGSNVTMFFTFWGLNILRRPAPPTVTKNLIERMFGWMMPRGADRLGLSRMNMAGIGTAMIKGIMRKKNVASLPELIDAARKAGVKLVACAMSMDLMGIRREELLDGVSEGGVAAYLNAAQTGNVNLFI